MNNGERPVYSYDNLPEPGKSEVALNGGHTELFLKKIYQFPNVREEAGILLMSAVYELLQSKTAEEATATAEKLFEDPDTALALADELFLAQQSWIKFYEVKADKKNEIHSLVDFHVILENPSDELLRYFLDFMKQELRQPPSTLTSGSGFLVQLKNLIDEGQTQNQEKYNVHLQRIENAIKKYFDIANVLDGEWPEFVARVGNILRELVQWVTQLQADVAQSDDPELKKIPSAELNVVSIMRDKYLREKRPAAEKGGTSNINFEVLLHFLEQNADAKQAQNLAFYDELRQLCTAFYDLHKFLDDKDIKGFYVKRTDIIGQQNSENYLQMVENARLFKEEFEKILFGIDSAA